MVTTAQLRCQSTRAADFDVAAVLAFSGSMSSGAPLVLLGIERFESCRDHGHESLDVIQPTCTARAALVVAARLCFRVAGGALSQGAWSSRAGLYIGSGLIGIALPALYDTRQGGGLAWNGPLLRSVSKLECCSVA